MRLNKGAAAKWLKGQPKGTSEDGNLWSLIDRNRDLGLELRRPFEREWILSLAFLSGRQYVYFHSAAHRLINVSKVKGQIRRIDNRLLPHWRRQVADMIKNDPQFAVVPNSNDEEDVQAANVGTKALKHFWRSKRMKTLRRQLAGWIYATGNGFLDHRWNPKIGPMEINPKTGKLEYAGDVDAGVWSPFEILVPAQFLGDTNLHSHPWLIKMKWRSLDYIRKMYPKRGKEVAPESQPTQVTGINLIMQAGRAAEKSEGAYLLHLYVQPCEVFPKGAFVTGANGIILDKQEYPFDYYNLEHFKDIDIPGVFWGKATSAEAIPLQTRWNKVNNSLDSFNEGAAKGKLLTPRRSNIEVMPDDGHGERFVYTPVMGHKPEWMTLKNPPATFDLVLSITDKSFKDLYSQHEVSQGTNRSDLRSGLMVDLLLEQDAHGNIPSHMIFEESFEAFGSRVLERMQAGYKNERFLKITGKDGEFEILAFKGTDLRNNTDVSVKRQSSLPDSRAAREARIMDRYGQGLYGNPNDPEVRRHVMNMLDDAVVKDMYGHDRLDEAYSRYENQILASGEADGMMVNDYDNHAIHVQEHNRFRKKLEYQKLQLRNPRAYQELEAKFTKHIQEHHAFLERMRQQALEEQRLLEGKGGDE